ncbi:MAG TPA: hypothetical protein VMJ32_07710, partial [Pirellulales bacterium]|nr:hypothetical protein [Pirellulales bacterium]
MRGRIHQLSAPRYRERWLMVLGAILLAVTAVILFAGRLWAASDNGSNSGGGSGTHAAAATAGATITDTTTANAGAVGITSNLTPEQLSARIAELIEHLGDAHYLVRQEAQNELYRIGPEAYDALTMAENNPDIEISSRAKYLVQAIRVQWIHSSESPQVRRILDKYELQDEAGRITALKELAFLRQDVGLAPLCHLLRFEKSPVVSKYTAMLIIGQPEGAPSAWAERQKNIEANLARNSGPGAQWLRAYIHFRSDPAGAAAEVDKLVDEELAGLAPFANEIERQNVLQLERRLVKVLEEKFNRRDRALDVLQKQTPLVANDPQAVPDFADLLVQHRAWKLIDELAHESEGAFNSDPALLYTLAHSRRAQGNTKEADELSERAFQLVGNKLEDHKEMGRQVCQLGLFDAAEREYRHVIKSSPQDTTLTIETQYLLSEMLHDQEHDLEAAEVLKTVVDAMDKDATVLQRAKEYENEIPDILRGNMYLFYACHA